MKINKDDIRKGAKSGIGGLVVLSGWLSNAKTGLGWAKLIEGRLPPRLVEICSVAAQRVEVVKDPLALASLAEKGIALLIELGKEEVDSVNLVVVGAGLATSSLKTVMWLSKQGLAPASWRAMAKLLAAFTAFVASMVKFGQGVANCLPDEESEVERPSERELLIKLLDLTSYSAALVGLFYAAPYIGLIELASTTAMFVLNQGFF